VKFIAVLEIFCWICEKG